ncbi:MAG TPA: efflux RND transporter permease subunit [Chthoniobacterales bacterium]|jgi:HAE1 family hydrophobic/amphiphilic exporter-1|nr:efflux RND transporter permease subunit [Chthoniobacterales bacterium]
MDGADEHDGSGNGEREEQDRHRLRPTSDEGGTPQSPKLVRVKGTGLSGPFIRRPVMTVLLTFSVIVAGMATYNKLAVNDLPAVDYPIIQVNCAYPGADPVTMANNIATPLEKQFLQIPGLDIITSSSNQGNTSLTLQFVLSKSITDAATDVQAAIQRATGKLPIDLPSPPTFSKTNPNDQAVYLVGLMSDTLTDGDLYKYASTVVAQRMAILPGVSQVNIYGVQAAIRIKADPAALAARGLTMDDLASGIKAGTVYSGAGQFDGPHRTFVLQPNGQIDQPEGYRNLIVARNKDNSPVYLRDVAEVKQSVQDERTSRFFFARGINPPGSIVVLAVSRQAGANAVEVANSVKALFPEFRVSLPGSISFIPVFDRSQTIVNSVHDVRMTLIIAFMLVVLVIYVFLGRATDTLIPVVALPLSLLLTFTAMYMFGFSINNLTLMAMTLAIGFLVDDAIVFLENVIRRAEHGESILTAAYNTAGEISFTILSMTLSLAAVFIPLVLLPGLLGRIFQEFSITIIVAILASGLVSLTLTPLMCARILGERKAGHKRARMEKWTTDFIQRVIAAYGRALDKFLDRAYLAVPILLICIIGLWFFFTHLPFTLLPVGDSGSARGIFIAQEGTSPEQMRAFQKQVNEKIIAEPSVGQFFTVAGSAQRSAASQAVIFAVFKPRAQRDPIEQCLLRLQKSISTIPGITAVITPQPVLQINVGATNQTQGQYAYTLSGIVPDDVYKAADQMMAKLRGFKGFASVRSDFYNSTPNLTVQIDRERAAMYGVSTSAIQSLLKNAYSQNYVYLIKQPDDQYQVILEAKDNERATPGDLNNLYLRGNSSSTIGQSGGGTTGSVSITTGTPADLVPLRAVTSTKQVVGPQAVNHFDQFTSVTINFNLLPGAAIGDATKFIEDSFADVHRQLPSVQSTFQGEALVFRQLFRALPLLLIGAIFVMYVILGILYESYVHPITVLFPAIVPAVVGGLATLWIFGSTLSLYSVIGLFLLLGIVKKNGIMVVDFALQRIDEGWDLRSAIHEASIERFRPIMMTTLAALMGAVPLALGFGQDASSRRPLGLVIVGGLIFSQMITLFVTPVIYLWLEWFQEHVLDKVPFLRSAHTHHEGEAPPGKEGEFGPIPAGAR